MKSPERPRSQWQVSFGVGTLCIEGSGVNKVVLDEVRVRPHAALPPAELEWYIYRYEKSNPEMPDSTRGHALEDSEKWPGDFDEQVARTEIVQDCTEARVEGAHVAGLALVLTADSDGLYVEGASVDYRADGRPYTLEIGWEWILCGDMTTNELLGQQWHGTCEAG